MSHTDKSREQLVEELESARREIEEYKRITDSTSDCIMRFDRDCQLIYANRPARELVALWQEGGVAASPDQRGGANGLCRQWEPEIGRVYETGKPAEFEFELIGESRFLKLALQPHFNAAGEVTSVVAISRDITETKKSLQELRLRGEIMANMPKGAYFIRARDGVIVYSNRTFEKMFGYEPGELVGQHVSVVNADTLNDPAQTARDIIDHLRSEGVWRGEIQNRRKDGTAFWCHASVSEFDHPDHGVIWISIHRDISECKAVEAQRLLMAQELDHRVKNNLAGVVSLMQQTAQTTPNVAVFAATFQGRLEGMARVHEMLASQSWSDIFLGDIVDATLSQFGAINERVVIDGPGAFLASSVAVPFGMALHELGINAAKYGALSHSAGRMRIQWSLLEENQRVVLEWEECAGSSLGAVEQGLGMRLVYGLIRHEIGGEATCLSTSTGLQWTLSIPAKW